MFIALEAYAVVVAAVVLTALFLVHRHDSAE